MKRITVVLTVLLLTAGAGAAQAQTWFWGLTYGMSVPSGDTNDFVSSTSWRNVSLEGRRVDLMGKKSVGVSFGWNVFNESGERTSQLPGVPGAVTGDQFRYINTFPMLVNGHLYFGQPGGTRPFVGANVGVYYTEYRLEIGTVAFEDNAWLFGGTPEIGVIFPTGMTKMFLSARYNITTSSGDIPSQQYFQLSVGLASAN
jgi:hypothetical protein